LAAICFIPVFFLAVRLLTSSLSSFLDGIVTGTWKELVLQNINSNRWSLVNSDGSCFSNQGWWTSPSRTHAKTLRASNFECKEDARYIIILFSNPEPVIKFELHLFTSGRPQVVWFQRHGWFSCVNDLVQLQLHWLRLLWWPTLTSGFRW
jgi:hypothetical protein